MRLTLAVGDIGTDKTALLSFSFQSFIRSRHTADNYAFARDQSNGAGDGKNHSQTKLPKLYEFKSNNGATVCILGAPGLADARGIDQDEKALSRP